MGGQRRAPAAQTPEKTRYPLYRRLCGPQGRSGQVRIISPPSGFHPRIVQPVASRYTDYIGQKKHAVQLRKYCVTAPPYTVHRTLQKNTRYHSKGQSCSSSLTITLRNTTLQRILFNAYGYICTSKLLGEWRLAGMALYREFFNINILGNFQSQTFTGAK
jgi:hypothetical protein